MPKAAAALLAVLVLPAAAAAEGERGPMFGGSLVAAHAEETDVSGVGAEVVFWFGRLGVGVEAAHQWSVDTEGPQVGSVSGSLRVLTYDQIVPSVLDTSDVVDLGIELHLIGERVWWGDLSSHQDRYGFGVAVRLRGVSDDEGSSLLAESRVFIRAMKTRDDGMDIIARTVAPTSAQSGVGVMIGLGVLFGGGQPGYVHQLRRRSELDADSIFGMPER